MISKSKYCIHSIDDFYFWFFITVIFNIVTIRLLLVCCNWRLPKSRWFLLLLYKRRCRIAAVQGISVIVLYDEVLYDMKCRCVILAFQFLLVAESLVIIYSVYKLLWRLNIFKSVSQKRKEIFYIRDWVRCIIFYY